MQTLAQLYLSRVDPLPFPGTEAEGTAPKDQSDKSKEEKLTVLVLLWKFLWLKCAELRKL